MMDSHFAKLGLISTLIFAIIAGAVVVFLAPYQISYWELAAMVVLRLVLVYLFPTMSIVRDTIYTVFLALVVVLSAEPGFLSTWFFIATAAVWSLLAFFLPRTPED